MSHVFAEEGLVLSEKTMTASELQRISAILSNKCFARHWLHWNYPQKDPWIMAIECREVNQTESLEVQDMVERGFVWSPMDRRYYIERTSEGSDVFGSRIDRMTEQKMRCIEEQRQYHRTGHIMTSADGSVALVDKGAVRWITKDQHRRMMHHREKG